MNYYIIVVESYSGETTFRTQSQGFLYAIVKIEKGVACIVDDGYRSFKEAYEAWKDKL